MLLDRSHPVVASESERARAAGRRSQRRVAADAPIVVQLPFALSRHIGLELQYLLYPEPAPRRFLRRAAPAACDTVVEAEVVRARANGHGQEVELVWQFTGPRSSFSARTSGTLDPGTHVLSTDGRVDDGRFRGARVHIDGRFDPGFDRQRFLGALR